MANKNNIHNQNETVKNMTNANIIHDQNKTVKNMKNITRYVARNVSNADKVHKMRIRSMKYGYIHRMQIIPMERGFTHKMRIISTKYE